MKTFLAVLFIILFPLSAGAGETIRVLLKDDQQRVEIRTGGEATFTNGRGEPVPLDVTPPLHIDVDAGAVRVNGVTIADPLLRISDINDEMQIDGLKVGGDLSVTVKQGNLLSIVAILDLEEYLKGVVPLEASPKWELEVLKAQAIAARTYALYNKKMQAGSDYDVTADVYSQVYSGSGPRSEVSDRAVDETAGLVMTYKGKLINAMFHGCCGGKTEDSEAVFGAPSVEYLKSVEGMCPPDGPKMQWEKWLSAGEIRRALEKSGYRLGKIKDIKVAARSNSKRVTRLLILHSRGQLALKGNDFRKSIGWDVVPSTLFTVKKTKDRYHFKGKGSGHGVGLCQLGARQMALQGKGFEEILHHYYTNVEIEPYRPDM